MFYFRIDELSDLMEHAQPSLIVDTRPFLSFRQSHVTGTSVCPSVCLSVYLSVCLSVFLPVCLFVFLSFGL